MARVQTISMYKAEDILITFTMNPVESITGWTILFTLRKSHKSPAATFTKNATIVSAAGGVFRIAIGAGDTDDLEPGDYVYDVTRTNSGSKTVLSAGKFIILPIARTV